MSEAAIGTLPPTAVQHRRRGQSPLLAWLTDFSWAASSTQHQRWERSMCSTAAPDVPRPGRRSRSRCHVAQDRLSESDDSCRLRLIRTFGCVPPIDGADFGGGFWDSSLAAVTEAVTRATHNPIAFSGGARYNPMTSVTLGNQLGVGGGRRFYRSRAAVTGSVRATAATTSPQSCLGPISGGGRRSRGRPISYQP